MTSANVRSVQSPVSVSAKRASTTGSRPIAGPTIPAVSRARAMSLQTSAAGREPRDDLGELGGLAAPGLVERHRQPALEAALEVVGGLPVAREPQAAVGRSGLRGLRAAVHARRYCAWSAPTITTTGAPPPRTRAF